MSTDNNPDTKGKAEAHTETRPEAISEAFIKDGIVPDVIDSPPEKIITIQYGPNIVVNPGNELRPADVKIAPSSVNWESDPNKFYVLVMIDPDAPSRRFHFLREVNHWMVVNIPGNEFEKGDTLADYRGSGPPPFSGLHRYVFLVYEQPQKLTFDEPVMTGISYRRMRFTVRQFTEKYKLGGPIAGNYFQAQY